MMDRWVNPFTGMALLAIVYSTDWMVLAHYGEYISAQTDYLFGIGVGVVMIWWVYLDRRRRRISLPFEFEAFVFFLWPFVLTWYFFKTH